MSASPFCIVGAAVEGSSHRIKGIGCQDAVSWDASIPGVVIAAVADGHGSMHCPYSADGASIAVKVFCDILRESLNGSQAKLPKGESIFSTGGQALQQLAASSAQRDDLVRLIVDRWKQTIEALHKEKKRPEDSPEQIFQKYAEKQKDCLPILKKNTERPEIANAGPLKDFFLLYGSTLLGLVVTQEYFFALRLGDGGIGCLSLTKDGVSPEEPHPYRIFPVKMGVETESLCQLDAFKDVETKLREISIVGELPRLFILFTDGFDTSYADQSQLALACQDYFSFFYKDKPPDEARLRKYLRVTSEEGSGDDVSLVLIYASEAIH